MARIGTLPLPMGDAVVRGHVRATFGRYYCIQHDTMLLESSRSTLALRPEQTAYKCPIEGCRLEAWL